MRWVLLAGLLAGCGPLPCLTDYCRAVRSGQVAPPPYQPMPMAPVYQAAPIPPMGPSRVTTTNCQKFGNMVNCSSY